MAADEYMYIKRKMGRRSEEAIILVEGGSLVWSISILSLGVSRLSW